jgi:hypothetical protein
MELDLRSGAGAVGTRTRLIEFRDMLVTVRNNVAALKQQGKSIDEIYRCQADCRLRCQMGQFRVQRRSIHKKDGQRRSAIEKLAIPVFKRPSVSSRPVQ